MLSQGTVSRLHRYTAIPVSKEHVIARPFTSTVCKFAEIEQLLLSLNVNSRTSTTTQARWVTKSSKSKSDEEFLREWLADFERLEQTGCTRPDLETAQDVDPPAEQDELPIGDSDPQVQETESPAQGVNPPVPDSSAALAAVGSFFSGLRSFRENYLPSSRNFLITRMIMSGIITNLADMAVVCATAAMRGLVVKLREYAEWAKKNPWKALGYALLIIIPIVLTASTPLILGGISFGTAGPIAGTSLSSQHRISTNS
jgi:hypothetical protein